MKHIYLFNKQSRASVSGIGTYISQIKEIVVNMDNTILNIVNYGLDILEFSYTQNEKGIRTFKFPSASRMVSAKEKVYMRNLWYVLFPYIKFQKSDELIFHFNYFQDIHIVRFIKENFPSAKTIFTIHYLDWGLLLEGNTSYFRRIIQSTPPLGRKDEQNIYNIYERDKDAFDKVDHIITLCKYTQTILIQEYQINRDKISFIPNGLKDEKKVLSNQEKNSIRKKWDIAENEKVILFVGRLERLKGLDELIEAFKIFYKSESNIRLLIVGDGVVSSYLSKTQKQTSKISFLGRLSKEELFELYQITNVGIIPSKNEQCNYVVIEMMMFDIPLVISSTSGLKEMSDHAILVEVKEDKENTTISCKELAEAMKVQLKNPILGTRIDYKQKYTLDRMQQNMNHLYNSLFTIQHGTN